MQDKFFDHYTYFPRVKIATNNDYAHGQPSFLIRGLFHRKANEGIREISITLENSRDDGEIEVYLEFDDYDIFLDAFERINKWLKAFSKTQHTQEEIEHFYENNIPYKALMKHRF